jgi:hypothetical protein
MSLRSRIVRSGRLVLGASCLAGLLAAPLGQAANAQERAQDAAAPKAAAKAPTDGARQPVGAESARRPRPATKFAPMVWLAKRERNGPMSAHTFIDYSELRWAHDTGCGDHSIDGTPSESAMGNGGYYEWDAAGQVAWPPCHHQGNRFYSNENTRPMADDGPPGEEGFFLDLDHSMHKGGGTGSPVYVQRYPRAVMYWFLYGYNNGPVRFNHEGDWERIAVRLGKKGKPYKVVYWRHGEPCSVRWKHVRKYNGHPVVFSAKGTHASYARKGPHRIHHPGPDVFYDYTSKGKRWKTWQNLDRLSKQPWYGYGGGWGEVGELKDTTGPMGPAPFRDDGGLRTSKRC